MSCEVIFSLTEIKKSNMIRICNKYLSLAFIFMGIFRGHDTALAVNIHHVPEFRDIWIQNFMRVYVGKGQKKLRN